MSPRLEAAFVQGRAAWPSIPLDAEHFANHVTAREKAGETGDVAHAADLYLACACARGVSEGVRAFDALLRNVVPAAISRIDKNPAFVDDVTQALREKLLIGTPPKISEYGGRAMLRNWLGTAAVRTALNMRRRKEDVARATLASSLGERVVRGPDIDYVRARYRAVFEDGLRAALAALSSRERALLKMNLVEHVTLERLASIYGSSRSTIARTITTARDKLLEGTREHLVRELGLSSSEYESLAAQLRSDVDVSIFRMLTDAADDVPIEK
jgi:RNA polymerase sigma-70 factor (ECF subfamily)